LYKYQRCADATLPNTAPSNNKQIEVTSSLGKPTRHREQSQSLEEATGDQQTECKSPRLVAGADEIGINAFLEIVLPLRPTF
jgi:hypothetical protein